MRYAVAKRSIDLYKCLPHVLHVRRSSAVGTFLSTFSDLFQCAIACSPISTNWLVPAHGPWRRRTAI